MERMTLSLPDGWKATIEREAQELGIGPSELMRRHIEGWITVTRGLQKAREHREDAG